MGTNAIPLPPTGDITTPEDVQEFVRRFYGDVTQDDLLGPLFTTVAQVDWPEHPANQRCDLRTRSEIAALVKTFYHRVSRDEILGPIFNDVAEVDWFAHIELLTNYWSRVLLGEPGYRGAILGAHKHIHAMRPLVDVDFSRWYQLWCAAVDARHVGDGAERAKDHAAKIAHMLSRIVTGADWKAPAVPG